LKWIGIALLICCILLALLWPAIRPARTAIGYEWGTVVSIAHSQNDISPPSAHLLIKTNEASLIGLGTRASFLQVENNRVCLKEFQEDKSGKLFYTIWPLNPCKSLAN